MRILLTGGAGFIGSHLADDLVRDGHELVVLDNLSTGHREQLPAQAKLLVGDVAERGAFDAPLDGVDACFHLAAISSVERSTKEWLHTHRVNQGGLVNLFSAIAARGKPIPVVYASSAAVYGNSAKIPLVEDSATIADSAYGVDKLSCEAQAHVATLVHHIPAIGLRPFNVYGPRQDRHSPYSGVISIFAERFLQHQPLVIHGDGAQSRDFIYVADVVLGLRLAMDALTSGKQNSGVYNLCTGSGTSVLQLVEEMSRIIGVKPSITHGAGRSGDVRHSAGDPGRAQKELGFHAVTSLRDGLTMYLKDAGLA